MNKKHIEIILFNFIFTSFIIFFIGCQKSTDGQHDFDVVDTVSYLKSFEDNRTSVLVNTSNHLVAVYRQGDTGFYFESEQNGSTILSTLTIVNNNQKASTQISVDESDAGYKLSLYKAIISEAMTFKENSASYATRSIIELYRTFGTSLLEKDNLDRHSPLIQSLFFHNGTLNTVLRSQESDLCECTPDPGFFVGKKSFWCQEDYMINPKTLLRNLNLLRDERSLEKNRFVDYLIGVQDADEISISKLYELESSKADFLNRVDGQYAYIRRTVSNKPIDGVSLSAEAVPNDCFEGSNHGCCGNYEGCCWYSHDLCLAHDVACLCCDSWWCLWGCRSEEFCSS